MRPAPRACALGYRPPPLRGWGIRRVLVPEGRRTLAQGASPGRPGRQPQAPGAYPAGTNVEPRRGDGTRWPAALRGSKPGPPSDGLGLADLAHGDDVARGVVLDLGH